MMPLEFSLHNPMAQEHIVFISGLNMVQPALCSFNKASQTVKLTSIKTNDIRHQGSSYKAGNFDLDITCNSANVDVQMAFKDVNNSNNTSNILTIQEGVGQAKGVGLQFGHQDGRGVVSFSPNPASFSNPTSNQWQVNGDGKNYKSSFDVYYVNTGGAGAVTAGRVQGNIIATIAYK